MNIEVEHSKIRICSIFDTLALAMVKVVKPTWYETPKIPEELHKIISDVVALFEDGNSDHTQVVQFKDEIVDACTQYGYASKRTLHVKQVAVHPSNRDFTGIHKGRAYSRLERVKRAGCSSSALLPNCICMEDNPYTKAIEQYNLDAAKKRLRIGAISTK